MAKWRARQAENCVLLMEIQEMLSMRASATSFAIAVLGCSYSSLGQTAIMELPRLSGADAQFVRCMSADGGAVVGSAVISGSLQAFRWTPQGGTVSLGSLMSGGHTLGYGISPDGQVVVGESAGRAFRWSASGGMQALQDGGAGGAAFGVSGDGLTSGWVVGQTGIGSGHPADQAVMWNNWPSRTLISDNEEHNRAGAISRDSRAVFGDSFNIGSALEGVLWRFRPYDGGAFDVIAPLMTGGIPRVQQCNAEGSQMVGNFAGSTSPSYAFLWREQAGLQVLGALPGFATSFVDAINGEGSLIAGSCRDSLGAATACLWDSSLAPTEMSAFLTARGVDLTGWTLTGCKGVSDDGRVFSGEGIHNGVPATWIVTVPAPGASALIGAFGLILARRRRVARTTAVSECRSGAVLVCLFACGSSAQAQVAVQVLPLPRHAYPQYGLSRQSWPVSISSDGRTVSGQGAAAVLGSLYLEPATYPIAWQYDRTTGIFSYPGEDPRDDTGVAFHPNSSIWTNVSRLGTAGIIDAPLSIPFSNWIWKQGLGHTRLVPGTPNVSGSVAAVSSDGRSAIGEVITYSNNAPLDWYVASRDGVWQRPESSRPYEYSVLLLLCPEPGATGDACGAYKVA